jgi:hypothetical protein
MAYTFSGIVITSGVVMCKSAAMGIICGSHGNVSLEILKILIQLSPPSGPLYCGPM